MTNGSDTPDDIDVLAGEYVLGLMGKAERPAFERRMLAEPEVQAAVAAARERFLELDTVVEPVAPSRELWGRIEAELGASNGAEVVSLDARRSEREAKSAAAGAPSQRGAFWRGFAAACVMCAIAAGAVYSQIKPQEPRFIVVLLDSESKPVSIVEALAGQRIRVVPLGRFDVPAGRTLQVWTLPDPATGPVSIGLLPDAGSAVLEGPALPAPRHDQLYEITLEPAGGSPTGRPTGPILGKGFARAPQI